MKKLILVALATIFISCSKPVDDSEIEMVFVVWLVSCGKEPDHVVLTTDKGIFTHDIRKVEEGSYEVSMVIGPDVYIVKDVTLNNSEGITHYVPHGYDERATSWVDDFEYDMTYDRKFVFSVFCND